MDIQLKTLERYLYIAIIHKQERMIIIHGLGTGTLKDAVHGVLKNTPEVKRYSNEWLGNYGFGATEVEFQY
jgi:dsDNA-specific endonuclease/ATPase MutS2